MSEPLNQSNEDLTFQIENLEYSYSEQTRPVLNIGKFEIKKGEKVFLQGESGSGKSTLLGIATGILSPQNGSVRVLGIDFVKALPSERDSVRGIRMGYIFQQFNLIPYLSTFENVALPCRLHSARSSRLNKSSVRSEVTRLLKALGLESFLDIPVSTLSVGQQQRVAVARALIGEPEFIIADEPTSALDHSQRGRFIELLMGECEKRKTTLLFVSHDPTLAIYFDRKVSMTEINRIEETKK